MKSKDYLERQIARANKKWLVIKKEPKRKYLHPWNSENFFGRRLHD